MSITLNGTTGITTPDIDSTAAPDLVGTNFTSLPSAQLTGALPAIDGSSLTSLPSAQLTGALPAIDGSSLTGIVIPPIFAPVAVSGATPSLDVGTYNFFKQGALTDNTTVSFASVPTNANWRYSFEAARVPNPWSTTGSAFVQSFSVAAQDGQGLGLSFKPDGTKMYVLGFDGKDVNEYDLSTAWDVTTAVYLQRFSVNAQDTSPRSISFKSDGTKMYMLGLIGRDVNEYDLSTAWDVTTAVYLQRFYVGNKDTSPRGEDFSHDGIYMYMIGATNDKVYQFTLSTAWDVSTAVYTRELSISSQESTPADVTFKSDGTKMFIVGTFRDRIYSWNLSTAWDISTAVLVSGYKNITEDNSPMALFFKSDGERIYIMGMNASVVLEYELANTGTLTLPAAVENPNVTSGSANLVLGARYTYDFMTLDGGTTVTLISEEVVE